MKRRGIAAAAIAVIAALALWPGAASALYTVERIYPGSMCVWFGNSYYDDINYNLGKLEVHSTSNGAWLYCPAVRWTNMYDNDFEAYMWLVDDSTSSNLCYAYHHSSSSNSYYYDYVSTTGNSSTPVKYTFDTFARLGESDWYFFFYCWINKKDSGDTYGSGIVSYYLEDSK